MFSVRSLILLALPLLAATRAVELDPRLSGLPDLPNQIGYSPLEALEHGFRAVHDAHRARKAAAEEEELQARGDRDGIPGAITTRNELIEGRCKPIIVIFGRGTTEPGLLSPGGAIMHPNAANPEKPTRKRRRRCRPLVLHRARETRARPRAGPGSQQLPGVSVYVLPPSVFRPGVSGD